MNAIAGGNGFSQIRAANLARAVVLAGFVSWLGAGLAQTVSTQPGASAGAAQPDSVVQVTAEAQGLQRVQPDQVPPYGTFWTISPRPGGRVPPPLPCPPLDSSLPIYAIADGQFLVDGTVGSPAALNAPQAAAAAAGRRGPWRERWA